MSQQNRRQWIQSAGLVGAGFWSGAISQTARAASEKMNIAVIGVGGRGAANLNGVRKQNQNIVALCDVDDKRAGSAYSQFPKAKKFHDYRRMFDKMQAGIDAVVISTPDHTHYHPSMAALQLNKHLYLEKPMAHSVAEVRALTKMAAKQKVATQLGVQRHTIPNVHRVVELIKTGAIGKVKEVHSWIGGTRGMPQVPTTKPEVPPHLKWNLWLGPRKERAYHKTYAPYGWRFWWDFGTGETGNWGCHILDIPFWALDLKYPTKVGGSGPKVHAQTTPKQMKTWFEFPAKGQRPAVKLYWYHANKGPDILRKLGLSAGGNNTLFIGSDGMLLCGFSQRKLLPETQFEGFTAPKPFIPRSPGFYREWIAACQGGKPATCDFAYSGPMTETVLLGNVAYRTQDEFKWDAKKLTATNATAQDLIHSEYRSGWKV